MSTLQSNARNGVDVDQLVGTIDAIKETPDLARFHGFLGLSDEVRPGYEGIRVRYRAKTDAPREKVEELCSYVQRTSPVMDLIRNPVPVSVSLEA